MATAFETFINDNMPSTLRAAIPLSGNLTAGIPLVPSGTGLNLEESINFGFKPTDSIFVSLTNPLADFTDLGEALVYARTNAPIFTDNGVFTIYVDVGTYTLANIDISSLGIPDVAIQIEGVVENDVLYSKTVSGVRQCKTYLILDALTTASYAVKMQQMYLIIKNCEVYNTSIGTLATDVACFYFFGGGLFFIDSKIQYISSPSIGDGSIALVKATAVSGIFATFSRCFIYVTFNRGIVDKTYSCIDFTGTSHPYLQMRDCDITVFQAPSANSSYAVFFNGYNTDTSSVPYAQCQNNKVRMYSAAPGFTKTVTFFKSAAIASVTSPNFFDKNIFISSNAAPAVGKFVWFDYDTVAGTGTITSIFNAFINEKAYNNVNIANVASGDTIKLLNCSYSGLMEKMVGSGILVLSPDEKLALNESIADLAYSGVTFKATVATGVVFGDVLYLDSSDNTYKKADATTSATCPAKAVSIEGAGSGKLVMRTGFIRSSSKFSLTAGADTFLATTAGEVSNAVPTTTGNIVQQLGWSPATDTLYFDPSQTYIELL